MLNSPALAVCAIAFQGGGPTPCCCWVPIELSCCIQVRQMWSMICDGVQCVAPHQNSGSFMSHTWASPGENGFSIVYSRVTPNGSRCRYKPVLCEEGLYCWHDPEWITWECKDEEAYQLCQQPQ